MLPNIERPVPILSKKRTKQLVSRYISADHTLKTKESEEEKMKNKISGLSQSKSMKNKNYF